MNVYVCMYLFVDLNITIDIKQNKSNLHYLYLMSMMTPV